MSAHARLSASAAHRWMACPASVRLSEGQDRKASEHAAKGTFAHSIAAECLTHDASPSDFFLKRDTVDGFTVECDLEMVDAVRLYVDEIEADHQAGDEGWIEHDVTPALKTIDPDMGGTADYIRYRKADKSLRVFDFKYGAGVYVEADDNAQLKIYALGAMLAVKAPVAEVEVTIVQPRYEGAQPVRSWKFPARDIIEFSADVEDAARRTNIPNAPVVPGDHCTFCPARRTCPELEKRQHALMAAEFADLSRIAPEELGKALVSVAQVKERIKAIEEYAYEIACRGIKVPGFKLVDKRPVRKWKSEGEVALWAQEKAIEPWAPRELLSPAQMEKKVAEGLPRGQKKGAAKAIEHLVEKVSSGFALVAEADDRPPAKLVTADDFAVVGTVDK